MSKQTVAQICNSYGEIIVLLMRDLIAPYSATGKTVKSIRYSVKQQDQLTKLSIYSRDFLQTLETGRGPRKTSTSGGMKDNIREWMKARGITKGSEKKDEQLARFLTYKINKEGDKTFKKGGREIFSDQIDLVIESLKKKLSEDFKNEAVNVVRSVFGNESNSNQTTGRA